jgi:hypothetical protein
MFTGNEDHVIPLSDGKVFTKNYRETIETGDTLGGFFGKRDLMLLLGQPACVGFRYYYGIDSNNEKVLVLVGTDENENDLINGIILEKAAPCPTRCGNTNVLNSSN